MNISEQRTIRPEVSSGFTIVELLIVIVVIGILASISIVAFNGVQDRARTATLLTGIDGYQKMLMAYKATHGEYPSTSPEGITDASYSICLGRDYPVTDKFTRADCLQVNIDGVPSGPVNNTMAAMVERLNSDLESVAGPLPSIGTQNALTIQSGSVTMSVRGATFMRDYRNHQVGGITYMVKADQECGRGTKTVNQEYPEIASCYIALD